MTYYKIVSYEDVNERDIYNNQFVNIYDDSGVYFTTLQDIHHFYFYGIYLIEILIDVNDPELQLEKVNEYKYKSNKIILGERFSLLDFNTYTKFNLDITKNTYAIDYASKYGFIDFLFWWVDSGINIPYTSRAMNWASEYGRIDVLNFWLILCVRYVSSLIKKTKVNFGFELKYDNETMDYASANGHINVLNWWIKSGLPLKYSKYAYDVAACNSDMKMIEWWENSGLKIKKFCDIDYFND
jgi:hypothetical protein